MDQDLYAMQECAIKSWLERTEDIGSSKYKNASFPILEEATRFVRHKE